MAKAANGASVDARYHQRDGVNSGPECVASSYCICRSVISCSRLRFDSTAAASAFSAGSWIRLILWRLMRCSCCSATRRLAIDVGAARKEVSDSIACHTQSLKASPYRDPGLHCLSCPRPTLAKSSSSQYIYVSIPLRSSGGSSSSYPQTSSLASKSTSAGYPRSNVVSSTR